MAVTQFLLVLSLTDGGRLEELTPFRTGKADRVEFDWLEDFLALVEAVNFSRAAEKRNISQPAFSRRIRMLETWLGADLFTRDTHKIELTPAGEQFRPTAEEVLRRVYVAREQVRDTAQGASSTLRFASTHALSMIFFPAWLQAIEAESKFSASVSLVTDNMVGCERIMLQGEAQFLLCHHHPSTPVSFKPNYFTSITIGDDMLVPVSAADASHEPLFSLPGSVEEPVPYVAYTKRSGMGRIIESSRALDGPVAWLAPAFSSHMANVIATMTRAGRGVAWLPISLIADDLQRGILVRAGDEDWDIPIEIRLYRPRARQSPKAEEFWILVKGRGETSPHPS